MGNGPWSYYGNPWVGQSLANLPLNGNARFSYRFTARDTGRMSGFQNFFISNTTRTGYAQGTGGTIRITLVPDNGNGLPAESNNLAQLTWRPGLSGGSAMGGASSNHTYAHPIYFADKYWPSAPRLVAGQTYHIIFENVDANPSANWLSLNTAYSFTGSRGALAPSIDDWGLAADYGSGWGESTRSEMMSGNGRYDLNLVVIMANGANYGSSYMEDHAPLPISGSSRAGQVFTPGRSVTVDSLSVHIAGSGRLRARLTANGSQVGSWTVNTSGSDFDYYTINTGRIELRAGTQYRLELSADSGSMSVQTWRDGNLGLGKTFPGGASWSDGAAQVSTNGSSWSNTFHGYLDLAGVVFRTAG